MSNNENDKDETICLCMDVTRGTIEKAVTEKGCKTFEDVQNETDAGLGCGSCEEDVQKIIDDLLKK